MMPAPQQTHQESSGHRGAGVVLLVLCILLLIGVATWEFARSAQGQSLGIGGSAGQTGPRGPAGPPGQDGLNGIDGGDGIDGVDGRHGVDGKDGADGVNGVDGKDGADGADGADGTGAGASVGLGQGTIALGSCDDAMDLDLDTDFRAGSFFIEQIRLSGINGDCDGQRLSIFLAIKDTGPQFGDPATYALDDVIVCTRTLAIDASVDTNIVDLIPGPCSVDGTGSAVSLGEVSTQDLVSGPGAIGVEVTG